ncbi:MAG: hypothetical protein R3C44_14050 [Chloroflexota bacterium]
MMDPAALEQSRQFVRRQGTAVEQARLRYLFNGDTPPPDVVEQFRRSQRNDGGWEPSWATEYSSVDATCYRLAQLDQLGLGVETPMVTDGIRFLAELQAPDGSWEEDADQEQAAPFWAMPGDASARLYLTANAGYWVGRSGLIPVSARDAADYLLAALAPDGQLASFLQAHWLAVGLWNLLGYDEPVARTLGYIDTRIDELPVDDLVWMLVALLDADVSAEHPAVAHGLDRLEALRDDEGVWGTDEGGENVAHVTVEALRALKLGGRLDG